MTLHLAAAIEKQKSLGFVSPTVPDIPQISDIIVDATSIQLTLSLNRGIADEYQVDFRPVATIARRTITIPYQQPTVTYSITDLQSVTEYRIEVVSLFGDLISNRQVETVMTGEMISETSELHF